MSSDFALRNAFLSWCDISNWRNPVAVTLTLKRSIRTASGAFISPGPGDYEQNLRHFINVLNRRIFGNKVRHGLRLKCIAVLEGDKTVRWHYHLLVERPRQLCLEALIALIVWEWGKTRWGYHELDVRPCDAGWLSYMTKFRSKMHYADSIDWLNCHH